MQLTKIFLGVLFSLLTLFSCKEKECQILVLEESFDEDDASVRIRVSAETEDDYTYDWTSSTGKSYSNSSGVFYEEYNEAGTISVEVQANTQNRTCSQEFTFDIPECNHSIDSFAVLGHGFYSQITGIEAGELKWTLDGINVNDITEGLELHTYMHDLGKHVLEIENNGCKIVKEFTTTDYSEEYTNCSLEILGYSSAAYSMTEVQISYSPSNLANDKYTIDWDFGDGHEVSLNQDFAQNYYSTSGQYLVEVEYNDWYLCSAKDTMTISR